MVTGFARRCCDWSSSPFPVGPFLAFGPVPRGAGLGFLSAGEVGGGASFGIFRRTGEVDVRYAVAGRPVAHIVMQIKRSITNAAEGCHHNTRHPARLSHRP